jgi:two-component system, OmpR family, response regulator
MRESGYINDDGCDASTPDQPEELRSLPDRDTAQILVVDDDPRVRTLLARYLEGEGFRVDQASNGQQLRERLALGPVDLILLDLGMPGEDGLTLAREVRSRSDVVGIIMLTGRADVIDRVAGLETGADDYLVKPFHLREVLARVRSVLRRTRTARPPQGEEVKEPPTRVVYRFEGWEVQVRKRRVIASDGREVALTTAEFDLLLAFLAYPGEVLDRDRLMELAKGRAWAVQDRSVDQQVARLRRKIEADPQSPSRIKSVRGLGYLFAADVRCG